MCSGMRMHTTLKTVVELLQVKERSNCENGAGHFPYESIQHCSTTGRASQTVVSELDGALTRSHSPFAYYMLAAFEAGSPFRGLLLLLLWPLICTVRMMVSEAASMQILIFICTVGIREVDLEGVGKAVLCKFYLEDLHSDVYRAFMACGRRCVVTSNPTVMVKPFLTEYLGVELVLGTELQTVKGYSTGFVKNPELLTTDARRLAVKEALQKPPDLGFAANAMNSSFLSLCKEAYMVTNGEVEAVPKEDYVKPLIFHDGRLAVRPTPMTALFIYMWLPIGLVLSLLRLLTWILLPVELSRPMGAFLGVRVRITGAPPLPAPGEGSGSRGSLYVCTHRTLLDPIFLSVALRRRVTAVTYSLSKVSETLSPIKTVTLSRRRDDDARTIESVLRQGDLVICPEGTTCREPYLLRFSPLFAEMTDNIVPVGTRAEMSLFHGTTARGFKGMDPFYFLMNPCPAYHVRFLDPLPLEETCTSGKTSLEVANSLQRRMGSVMGYQCTTLTRKDKYRVLAGNDGLVPSVKSTTVCSTVQLVQRRSTSKTKLFSSGFSEREMMVTSTWVGLLMRFFYKQQGC